MKKGQMSEEITQHEILVPPQHAKIQLVDANETFLFGSRGSFKSSVGLSLYNLRRVFEMPRSTGVGVGISFNNLYENTLPPFKAFLLEKGFVEDVHFTISKPPPRSWPTPYIGVVDRTYKNTMTWYNGTSKQFISLMRKASANGVSAQWGDFDEVKFMSQKVLTDYIFPIFRGNEKHFRHCSGYLSKFFLTDKNADPGKIQWLLNKRDQVDQRKVDIVIALQIELDRLKALYNQAGKGKKLEIKVQIHAVETRLAILRARMVYVSEINADDVKPILGKAWYDDKRKNTSTYEWDIIYLNKDPSRPENTFYPAWDLKRHVHSTAGDIRKDTPLIIASDYQHTVAPIPVAQLSVLPGQSTMSLNFIDDPYTLHPKGLRDAVKLFCTRHADHECKQVYYVYDHTAIGERVDADRYCAIVVDELENNGWQVYEINIGQAPGHFDKYTDTIDWMSEEKPDCIPIRIHCRCTKLIKSVTGAGAKIVGKETKKDKSVEIQAGLDQSETTHFSDAMDMILNAVLKQRLISEIIEHSPIAFR
jgi:hypothetical protein